MCPLLINPWPLLVRIQGLPGDDLPAVVPAENRSLTASVERVVQSARGDSCGSYELGYLVSKRAHENQLGKKGDRSGIGKIQKDAQKMYR